MYGCKSDHRSNASHKEEIDVENGDLSAWEYLTANFDDDEFLQEHNGTAKNGVDITSNVFMQDAIQSFDERLCFSCPHFYRHSKDVTGEGMLTNFLIVPLPSADYPDQIRFPATSFTSMTTTPYNSNFLQTRIDHNDSCGDIHHPSMNLPSLSVNGHCDLVDLSSNPYGLLNQFEPASGTLPLKSAVHQPIEYSPPLPPYKILKPLTSYHYFYRVERDNIMQGIGQNFDQIPDTVHEFSERKLRELLDQRWYKDPIKKRRAHRKTLGELGFENFSKIIAERWRKLSREGRQFYRRVAEIDKMQYERYLRLSEIAEESEITGTFL